MWTNLVGSASVSCDRLPKLDTISFRIGEPAKLSELIAFAFWIDGDTFVPQTVQHAIQVVHLEIYRQGAVTGGVARAGLHSACNSDGRGLILLATRSGKNALRDLSPV